MLSALMLRWLADLAAWLDSENRNASDSMGTVLQSPVSLPFDCDVHFNMGWHFIKTVAHYSDEPSYSMMFQSVATSSSFELDHPEFETHTGRLLTSKCGIGWTCVGFVIWIGLCENVGRCHQSKSCPRLQLVPVVLARTNGATPFPLSEWRPQPADSNNLSAAAMFCMPAQCGNEHHAMSLFHQGPMLGVFYGRDFYAHTSQNLSPSSLAWKSGELRFPKMTWCIQKALTPTFSFEVDLRTVTVNSTRKHTASCSTCFFKTLRLCKSDAAALITSTGE